MTAQLVLGTASFGGHARRNIGAKGTPDREEVAAILRRASGLDLGLDTAAAYGDIEDKILFCCGIMDITTKLLPHLSCAPALLPRLVRREVQASYLNLAGGPMRVGFLFHTPAHGADPEYVSALRAAWDGAIGTSLYTVAEFDALVPGQDIVQFPYNVFDRRFEAVFPRIPVGMKTYARSPFCQGLALLDPLDVPTWHSGAQLSVAAFQSLCARYGVKPVEACLRFALESPADYVVFGVDSLAQFEEDVAVSRSEPSQGWPELKAALNAPEWREIPEPIVLPSLWATP